jgi:hypothetical protein
MTLGLGDLAFLGGLGGGAPDIAAYIAAVEDEDGQALEPDVVTAISDFVLGCNADGIWSSIKACCILAGARTLNGALVPLVGAAPTNNGIAAGDYNRKTGVTKALGTNIINTNRANNADPQNNHHFAMNVSTLPTTDVYLVFSGTYTSIERFGNDYVTRHRSATADFFAGNTVSTGLIGLSRSAAGSYTRRVSQTDTVVTRNSSAPDTATLTIFANFDGASAARVNFYSIGESLNLALLNARVTTLMNAFAAAIP